MSTISWPMLMLEVEKLRQTVRDFFANQGEKAENSELFEAFSTQSLRKKIPQHSAI